MTSFIKEAVPTDFKLQNKKSISPFEARQLYPHKIKSGRNFKCEFCGAPITCRAISKECDIAPVFIDQITKENRHGENCRYNKKNRERINSDLKSKERKHKNYNNGHYKSLLSSHGFVENNKSINTKECNSGEEENESVKINSKKTRGNQITEREVKTQLKTLEEHVLHYLENEHSKIYMANGAKREINKMFVPIHKNVSLKRQRKIKYPLIYYGKGYINSLEGYDDLLQVQFKDKIDFNGVKGRPSFIVHKKYIEKNYADIYEAYEKNNQHQFNIFITLPFIKMKGENKEGKLKYYINFSSFEKNEVVKANSKELLRNMYIY
ncbi:hypothetical protein ABXT16_11480 [Staphylococcus epidermidis]|uniref:hypothetical protein n=1 Tax=Staphylococcus epidermidis TaxID=1282 RepID=UPI003397A6A5